MLKEFREFLAKGNVLELAVGVIMATYFGAIVKSLVNDIIMPPVGLALGGVDFAELKLVLKEGVEAVVSADGTEVAAIPEVAVMYGSFINTIITFVIVGFCVFMVVKAYNRMKRKEEKKPEPSTPPPPSKEVELLIEIRDALRK
jgi:large conductance mechanosensitive channel